MINIKPRGNNLRGFVCGSIVNQVSQAHACCCERFRRINDTFYAPWDTFSFGDLSGAFSCHFAWRALDCCREWNSEVAIVRDRISAPSKQEGAARNAFQNEVNMA